MAADVAQAIGDWLMSRPEDSITLHDDVLRLIAKGYKYRDKGLVRRIPKHSLEWALRAWLSSHAPVAPDALKTPEGKAFLLNMSVAKYRRCEFALEKLGSYDFVIHLLTDTETDTHHIFYGPAGSAR
jgi:hypothetical protein